MRGVFVTCTALLACLLAPAGAKAQQALDMWRLYNPYTGEHFYTADVVERDELGRLGWHLEGVGWTAPASGTEVWRLYNPFAAGGDHHYTMSHHEYVELQRLGWRGEGVGWRSAEKDGGVTIWRQYNPNSSSGSHNYTPDTHERDELVRLGWVNEGVGWYGASSVPEREDDSGQTEPNVHEHVWEPLWQRRQLINCNGRDPVMGETCNRLFATTEEWGVHWTLAHEDASWGPYEGDVLVGFTCAICKETRGVHHHEWHYAWSDDHASIVGYACACGRRVSAESAAASLANDLVVSKVIGEVVDHQGNVVVPGERTIVQGELPDPQGA